MISANTLGEAEKRGWAPSEENNEHITDGERGLYMKRFCLWVGLLGVLSTAAMANQLCTNGGTYDTYITNYNSFANACQIGDKLFWGFQHTAGANASGQEPFSSEISVHAIPGDGFSNIGISFNSGGWVANSTTPINDILTYNVATLSASPIIKDATLTITGTLTGLGDHAQVVETLTPGVAGSPLTATLNSPASVNIVFLNNMQAMFAVKDEISLLVDPGNNTQSHVSIVENDFSELVPEPLPTSLIGSGLLLFGLVLRKRVNPVGAEESK